MRLLALALILLCPFLAFPARAADNVLVFKDGAAITDIREQQTIEMLQAEKLLFTDLPFTIAATDLNGDGIDEWLIRQDTESNCKTNATCHFFVAALSQNKPIVIGNITAGKVALMDTKLYGVTRLAVYSNPTDDFDFEQYVWHSELGRFGPI